MLTLKKTVDINDIKTVLCTAVIYNSINEDGSPLAEEFDPPITDDYLYIGGYVKDKLIALMIYHKYLDGNICHVQVLPEHRKEHAVNFGEQALEFRGTLPLYAEIPTLYKNVLDFALRNDFRVVDVKENEYIKNGETYNVNVLRYK